MQFLSMNSTLLKITDRRRRRRLVGVFDAALAARREGSVFWGPRKRKR